MSKTLTSEQMLKTRIRKDQMFWNVAPLGSKPRWKVIPKPDSWMNDKEAPPSLKRMFLSY